METKASTADSSGARSRPPSARNRILAAAYELFSRRGIGATGIDAVIRSAGVSRMTLYRHFPSKTDLVLAFLERRGTLFTEGWLAAEVERRATNPVERLLAIFDIYATWFASDGFEGCSFVNTMLETTDHEDPVYKASVANLEKIRSYIAELAAQAGISDPAGFARKWYILMKGAIVSAAEGDRHAAKRAREIGQLVLQNELA